MKKHILKYLTEKERYKYSKYQFLKESSNSEQIDKNLKAIYRENIELYEELAKNRYVTHTRKRLSSILNFNQKFLTQLENQIIQKIEERGISREDFMKDFQKYISSKSQVYSEQDEQDAVDSLTQLAHLDIMSTKENVVAFSDIIKLTNCLKSKKLNTNSFLESEIDFLQEITNPLNISTPTLLKIINESATTYLNSK